MMLNTSLFHRTERAYSMLELILGVGLLALLSSFIFQLFWQGYSSLRLQESRQGIAKDLQVTYQYLHRDLSNTQKDLWRFDSDSSSSEIKKNYILMAGLLNPHDLANYNQGTGKPYYKALILYYPEENAGEGSTTYSLIREVWSWDGENNRRYNIRRLPGGFPPASGDRPVGLLSDVRVYDAESGSRGQKEVNFTLWDRKVLHRSLIDFYPYQPGMEQQDSLEIQILSEESSTIKTSLESSRSLKPTLSSHFSFFIAGEG